MTELTTAYLNLQVRTRAALAKDSRSSRAIADAAKVTTSWLAKFRAGEFRNPEVAKVERVYRVVSKKAA